MQRERENDQKAIVTVLYKNKAQESVESISLTT